MKFLLRFFLMMVISGCNYIVYAQDSIDVFVQNMMQQRRIPGLQLAIVKDGKIVKTGNYGFANLQDSIPVSDRTVFTINSITKAFTGVAVMQLFEAGRLNLSSPVSAYLTGLPDAWKGVTILQLLAHTSGIPDIVDEEESVLISSNEEEAWKKITESPMEFKSGEQFRYNQTNYLLLGRVIDTLSGMPFTEYIIKTQLQPVGMTKTIQSGFGANKDVIPNAAGGYTYRKGKLNNMFFSFPPSLQTAAGMSSTATEMANWLIALQSQRILKEKSSLALMWSPAKLNSGKIAGFGSLLNGYAVGWPIVSRTEHPAAAGVGGGRSAVFVYPNDNISIVVLTNLAGGSPEGFIDEIAGFYMPDMKEVNGFGLSPAVKKLRGELEIAGYKNAAARLNKLKKASPSFQVAEADMNTWGYRLMRQGRLADALEIFKLNVMLHPKSANAYDSLGEIYAESGNAKLALENYEQSLTLDPTNAGAEQMIRRLRSGQ